MAHEKQIKKCTMLVPKLAKRNKKSLLFILILTMIFPGGISSAEPTINDKIYTKKQAKIGQKLYKEHCLACHDKKYYFPVLKAWDGESLGLFYTVMSATMPESNPGSLPDKDYVDILAYILSISRYPSGANNLEYRIDKLNDITIAQRN